MDKVKVWKNSLSEIEVTVSKANFTTWFKNTFIIDYKKGVFIIGVPTFFVEDWLKKKYIDQIRNALENQSGEKVKTVRFKIATPEAYQIAIPDQTKFIHNPVDKSISKKPTLTEQKSLPKNSTLNNIYLFENFVVGPSNQLAHAASDAVAKTPGSVYNPLFIYGESGLGKTHLMQAIGHQILTNDPNKKILYVSTETFVNDFIQAVEVGSGRAKDFKNRYRTVDILLIDDIQFLSGKESTQEEFFHTFNHLHQNNKQVVLTADRFPKAIKGLEKRLQTRFEGGMVADISQPDIETRAAILKRKSARYVTSVDDEVINFIAENIKSSIRELEGALTKVIAMAELKKVAPTKELAAEVLNKIIEISRTIITPELVIKVICKHYSVPKEDLLGRKRTKDIVTPRQVLMYLMRHEINLSFPLIGKEMGGKDHTTIMHGCNKIEAEMSLNPKLKEDIATIKDSIHTIVG